LSSVATVRGMCVAMYTHSIIHVFYFVHPCLCCSMPPMDSSDDDFDKAVFGGFIDDDIPFRDGPSVNFTFSS